jgi:uncharacterized membrane protein
MSAIIIVGIVLYMLPTFIAYCKGTRHAFGVLITNIFAGWIPFIWLLLLMCVIFYWPTWREYQAMLDRERLSEDADRAVVAMEERSREALKFRQEPTFSRLS